MAAVTVEGRVRLPDGTTPRYSSVDIELVASLTGKVIGWVPTADLGIAAYSHLELDEDGEWSCPLQPNSLIDPSNTVYRITYRAKNWTSKFLISVPDSPGPHRVEDLLSVSPDDLPPNALNNEIAARIAGDAALDGRLDTLEADPTTGAALVAETAARTTADAAEVIARAAADTALDGRLDTLEADPTTGAAVTAVQANLTAHIGDTTDAHAATAITFTPTGTIAATTAQAAIAEVATDAAAALATEAGTRSAADVALDGRLDVLEADPTTGAALTAHAADTTAIHGIADTSLLIDTGDVGLSADIRAIDIGDTVDPGTTGRWADAGHQHVLLAPAVPVALGSSAAAGVATRPARSDHVHPYPSAANVGADPTGTAASVVVAHEADTTSVHGIADTSTLYRAGGADVAVADGGTGSSTALGARSPSGLDAQRTSTVDIREKGAVSGQDCTTAINDALATGQLVFVPVGTWDYSGVYVMSGPVRMVGQPGAVIRLTGSSNVMFYAAPAVDIGGTFFDSITFDITVTSHLFPAAFGLYGQNATPVRFERCGFIANKGTCILTEYVSQMIVDRCDFRTPDGIPGAIGIILNGGRDNEITNSTFDGLRLPIRAAVSATLSADPPSRNLKTDGNRINGHWMTGRWTSDNSGGTVTYSSTGLTDTAASFTGLTVVGGGTPFAMVRALVNVDTGTKTGGTNTTFEDSAADWVSAGVRHGYLIRTATAYAKVDRVLSATKVATTGWRSLQPADFNTPIPQPADTTAFTMYKPIWGRVDSFTSTTITTVAWVALDGTPTTPPAGTRYELVDADLFPVFGIHLSIGVERAQVTNNFIEETWVEAIYACCSRSVIADNTCIDGQDMGITLSTAGASDPTMIGRSVVTGNLIYHHAAAGIAVESDRNVVSGNRAESCGWRLDLDQNDVTRAFQCGLVLMGNDNVISGFVADAGTESAVMRAAVGVLDSSSDNQLRGIKSIGTVDGDYHDGGNTGTGNTVETVEPLVI